MQSKQIKVGGEYAYARSWQWNSRYDRSAYRVKVLAVGQPRDTWSSGYGRNTRADGVKIEFLDREGAPTQLVKPAEIRQDWEEFATEKAERDARHDHARARMLAEQTAIKERLDNMFELMGDVKRPYWTEAQPSGTTGMHGDVYGSALADLLEAAYDAGKDAR